MRFRRGFSTIDHIHTITKLIEVSREYMCLTFIDLKKAFDSVETEAKTFDSVETEAVMEALLTQGVPTHPAHSGRSYSVNHIHTITKLIEVSREYKLPLCLTFIELKKAFDSVETEACVEALLTPLKTVEWIHYQVFTILLYNDIVINGKGGVRRGIPYPKCYSAPPSLMSCANYRRAF
ncbi:unnamed protein product [Heligmosomoides polygyrus]|uniref:Reverse transcriptase domain-containing protein n=1 Tax=Heligmosomoides polygyrus TaxID=6339 RepID=A0A183G8T0_HELPZ|nr:unnamed protein product [Heligmosomoides polygyrus]